MNYYDEQIAKIKFYEIEYVDVNTINDHIFLEKKIDKLLVDFDKKECLIKAENLRNKADEEKQKLISVYYPSVMSITFGIYQLVTSVLFNSLVLIVLISAVLNIVASMILNKRTSTILRISENKIMFYNRICEIIREKS